MCFLKAIVSWHHDFAESFWHRGTVNQTSFVSLWFLVAFEKVPVSSAKQKGINVFISLGQNFWLHGVNETAESEYSNLRCEYHCKIGATIEIALASQSGAYRRACFVRKELRVKISWHRPFKENTAFFEAFLQADIPNATITFHFWFYQHTRHINQIEKC